MLELGMAYQGNEVMQIFLSYASEDRDVAEEIQLALAASGHEVFFDKSSLPPGHDYHARIQLAVQHADIFIFLISSNSVRQGSYALTELKFARTKWPNPRERLLPVRLHGTELESIPAYLRSVTMLEPEGNTAAEIVDAVAGLVRNLADQQSVVSTTKDHAKDQSATTSFGGSHRVQIWVAIIGLLGVLGAAIIAKWPFLPTAKPVSDSVPQTSDSSISSSSDQLIQSQGLKGADTGAPHSPVLNDKCPEITIWDYSKSPVESRIVRMCDTLNKGKKQ